VDNLPAGYLPGTTFHPTFLYESVWNALLCVVLILIDRKTQLRPGRLFAIYLAGYFTGRFWIEGLRIDTAHVIAGLRLNQWVSAVVVAASVAFLIIDKRRGVRGTRVGRAAAVEPVAVDGSAR
jgi:prolipoprotein diacylglyceryltransferase